MEKFGIAKSAAAQSIKDILTKIAANELQITSTASKIQTSQGFLVDDAEVQQQLIQCDTSTVETQIEVLSQIQKPDLSKYQTIEDGIAKKQAEFHEIRAQHRQARQTWTGHYSSRKIQKEIATLDCPHCSEKLVMGSNVLLKATDIVAQQKHIQEHNAQIEEKMAAATIEIEELQAKLDGEVKITELANKIKAKRQEDSEEYHQAISRISELRSQKTRLEVTAASWKNKLKESKALQVKIEVYEKDLVALKANADKLRSEQTMAETLAHLFSPTGVSAYIFDMVIDMLNGRVTEYIETLWPNASYQLLSFKETKAGETRAKFSEKIILGGKERSLGSLSGGELRCLSLAVDLAVIDVVCKISGIQLNPLILDEAFDGMDNANRERAMDLVSKLSINKEIWIIDHSSEVCSMFSKTVRAEKRNEVTVLV